MPLRRAATTSVQVEAAGPLRVRERPRQGLSRGHPWRRCAAQATHYVGNQRPRRARAAMDRLPADDFVVTSPLDDHIGKDAFFERCFPTAHRLRSQNILDTVPTEGDQVFVRCEYQLTTGERHRNVEVLTVRDGRITEAQVYFGGSSRGVRRRSSGRRRPRGGRCARPGSLRSRQTKTTQEAAGASTEPARVGMPVRGSRVNQVMSPERSLAA